MLAAFCIVFAINSAVHSYLILRYSEGDKVAMNIGFYYMSNAMGRLIGTLGSGALYSYVGASEVDGFGFCFVLSTVFCVICIILTIPIKDNLMGLSCGSFFCVAATVNHVLDSEQPNVEEGTTTCRTVELTEASPSSRQMNT